MGKVVRLVEVIGMLVARYTLDLTQPTMVKLQQKEIDLLKAEQEISSLRENVEEKHHELYVQVVKRSEAVGVTPTCQWVVQHQVHIDNLLVPNIKGYYRANLTVVFLYHSLQQLQAWFLPEAYICCKGFSIVCTVLLSNLPAWKDANIFCEHYTLDIPNVAGLPAELHLLKWKEEKGDEVPDRCPEQWNLLIRHLFHILATIPVKHNEAN